MFAATPLWLMWLTMALAVMAVVAAKVRLPVPAWLVYDKEMFCAVAPATEVCTQYGRTPFPLVARSDGVPVSVCGLVVLLEMPG